MTEPWLTLKQGDAPLLVSFPHTGMSIPAECAAALMSFLLARHDADRHIDKLYAFATELGATTVHTALSRTVIDVNRDPSGASLYPGQTTTGLVPTETFDGRPLYRAGQEPTPDEIERRKALYFAPYHLALVAEIKRLRAMHPRVVLYDGTVLGHRVEIHAGAVIGADGFGYRLQEARQYIRMDRMFVGLIELGVLGALLDFLFVSLSRRIVHWEKAS